jgi:hypothetical protein
MADGDNQALLLQVSADLNKLEKAWLKATDTVDKKSGHMEKRAKKLSDNLNGALTGEGFGKSLEKIFNSSRFSVLDEAGAKVRIFGSALEPLGAVGVTAAAGVVAFALAMEKTEKAVEAGAQIAKLGKELGVTTDFVQEFTFALRQSDIDIGVGSEALKRLNENLGNVKDGLAKKNVANAFGALGLTPAALRQFHDAGELLPVLAERIARVGDASEKAGIAKKLGVAELLPLLKDGADGFDALAQKARDLNIVLGHDTIEKAEEAKKKFAELNDVMKARANATFLEFADTLVAVKTAFLEAEKAGLSFLAAITGTKSPKTVIEDTQAALQDLSRRAEGKDLGNGVRAFSPSQKVLFDHLAARLNAAEAQVAAHHAEPPPAATGTRPIPPPKTAKQGPRDDTVQRGEAIDAALANSARGLLAAQLLLTGDLNKRAELERQIAAEEAAAAVAGLQKQKAELAADKGFKGDKSRKQAELDLAIAATQQAADAKAEAVDRQVRLDLEDRQIEVYRAIVEAQIAQLEAEASISTTAKAREAIERRILELRQGLEADLQANALDRRVKTGEISPEQALAEKGALSTKQGADKLVFDADHESPIQKYLRSIQDLNTTIANDGVSAAHDLAQGLAEAATGARTLGDVARNVFLRLSQQILQDVLEKNVTGPLAKAGSTFLQSLFKPHALGTNFAEGGPAIVGEQGPEALWLPRGSKVMPSGRLRALMNVPAPGYGGGAAVSGGGGFVQHNEINFNGPVSNGRDVRLSAQQAQAQLARAAAAGRRGV